MRLLLEVFPGLGMIGASAGLSTWLIAEIVQITSQEWLEPVWAAQYKDRKISFDDDKTIGILHTGKADPLLYSIDF